MNSDLLKQTIQAFNFKSKLAQHKKTTAKHYSQMLEDIGVEKIQ